MGQYFPHRPLINTPLIKGREGKSKLDQISPFVEYCNAICQITIQTSVEAEAPFALSTLDYISEGLDTFTVVWVKPPKRCSNIERLEGSQQALDKGQTDQFTGTTGWTVEARGHTYAARSVLTNLTPHALEAVLNRPVKSLTQKAQEVEGYEVLQCYLSITDHPKRAPDKATHIQCVNDSNKPLRSGKSHLCSLGGRTRSDRGAKGFKNRNRPRLMSTCPHFKD